MGSLTPTPIPTTTPYVRRYFQGRLIATPPPTPMGSVTPTPIPTATPIPTTTPYVRRYFNGRPIDTPPPTSNANLAPTPSANLTPTPIPTTTPYVRRYFNGRPIDTPPPTPAGSNESNPAEISTPTPIPSPTSAPHRAQPTQPLRSDKLIGDWDCTTFGGTNLTHAFSRADDGVSLYVNTNIRLTTGRLASLHELYAHNPDTHRWTAILAGGLIYAKGPDWRGKQWILAGHSSENGAPVKFRMVFSDLGAEAYRRDFQRMIGGAWATYAGETCRRATP
jgi:hypothetical protein